MADAKNPTLPEKPTAQDGAQAPIATESAQSPTGDTETPTGDSGADLVVVKFSEHWALYSAGETAGFSTEKAEWLINRKIAVKA